MSDPIAAGYPFVPEGGLRPLRFAAMLRDGESVPGLLAWATADCVLGKTAVALERIGLPATRPGYLCVKPASTIRALAAVLRCDADDLVSRSHPYRNGGRVGVGSVELLRGDLSLSRRRIAPSTLTTIDQHMDWWLVRLLPFCPISLEPLVDKCARCGRPLGWRKAWGIGRCEWCEHTIEPSRDRWLSETQADGYRLFADLISVETVRHRAAMQRLPSEVAALPPSTVVDMVLRMGSLAGGFAPRQLRLDGSHLSAVERARAIAEGIELLMDWPAGLSRLQASYLDPDAEPSVRKQRLTLLRRSLIGIDSPPGAARLVTSAVPLFGSAHKIQAAATGRAVMRSSAAVDIGVDHRDLRRLEASGYFSQESDGSGTLSRTLVEEARLHIRGARSIGHAAYQLGLPSYAIEQMCCLKMLRVADHPAVLATADRPRVVRDGVASLQAILQRQARKGTPPPDAIDLRAASRFAGGGLKPWGHAYERLIARKFVCWITASPARPKNIMVWANDAALLFAGRFEEQEHPDFPFASDVCRSDVEEILNVPPGALDPAGWHAAFHFVPAPGFKLLTARAAVERAAAASIAPAELAVRSGRHQTSVQRELDRLGVPRTEFGWRRDEVRKTGIVAARCC